MTSPLVQKLTGTRDLKKILETTVKDLTDAFHAETCQVMLTNPLDPNVTSICEYRAARDEPQELLPTTTLPLVLHGRTMGSLSLARQQELHPDEVNVMRVILGELGDIIRGAQINDIVQRDTFRDTFLVEIGNVMAYSLGFGDALFMVVNILGKVLQVSRCLFICTDDAQAGWKCYEYWQQDKVQSCQDYRWPTSDSPLVAQVLLKQAPLNVYEGQINSYVSPVQEELQFISVKSLLGVPLRSADAATHGCVILQQCDYRRAWTRNEIDMVQNVADKVAEALVKLPAEKRAREPIMQLHQRIVAVPQEGGKSPDAVSVRNALKGALGHQAIPSARKSTAAPPKPAAAAPVARPAAADAAKPPAAPPTSLPPAATPAAPVAQPEPLPTENFSPGTGTPTISPVQAKSTTQERSGTQEGSEASFAPPSSGKSLGSILGAARGAANATPIPPPPLAPPEGKVVTNGDDSKKADPYADLDFGDFAEAAGESGGAPKRRGDADSTWGKLEAFKVEVPGGGASPSSQAETIPPGAKPAASASVEPAQSGTQSSSPWGDLDSIPTPKAGPKAATAAVVGGWGDLDTIATPAAATVAGGVWANLDAIPTPGGASAAPAPRGGGLSAMMGGKARAAAASKPFGKARAALQPPPPVPTPQPEQSEQQAEVAAQAKLKAAQKADVTSDYIFATPGFDPRTAGRIFGWIQEIEEKDGYAHGHARQVADLSVAIAKEAGLSQSDLDLVRQSGLLHDVGKRACPSHILQKRDEDLSDPELFVMMRHPIDGAELLESFADLKHLAEIVRTHHEEFDGNGYPQGLKGDEIPVAARIIAVANSYHSLTSEMIYGPGMATTQAQEELVKGAGKQWDPTFVQALIQAIMAKRVPAL